MAKKLVQRIFRKFLNVVSLIKKHPKGLLNFFLSTFSLITRSTYVLGKPVHITIEPTTACNLKCPVCETGSGTLNRPQGEMSLGNLKKIIDKIAPHTNAILFYFMGEPFLNRNAYEMIKYARDHRIFVTICTNGEYINAKRLVDSGLNEISFQIGGITQETHETYRVNGKLNKVFESIRNVVAEKKRRGICLPRVIVGFIIMKHNEHQVNDFYKLGRELEVDECQVVNPCVRTIKQGIQFLPADERYWFYDRSAFSKGILRPRVIPNNRCEWIYYSTVITWDGNVVPCCRDAQGDYVMGNLFEESFDSIWNNEKYRKFRKKISTAQSEMPLCKLCSGYGIPSLKQEDKV